MSESATPESTTLCGICGERLEEDDIVRYLLDAPCHELCIAEQVEAGYDH